MFSCYWFIVINYVSAVLRGILFVYIAVMIVACVGNKINDYYYYYYYYSRQRQGHYILLLLFMYFLFYFVNIDERPAMGSQPNLATVGRKWCRYLQMPHKFLGPSPNLECKKSHF